MLALWLAIWRAPVAPARGAFAGGATNGGRTEASLRSGVLTGAERGGALVTAGTRGGTLGVSTRGGQVIEG